MYIFLSRVSRINLNLRAKNYSKVWIPYTGKLFNHVEKRGFFIREFSIELEFIVPVLYMLFAIIFFEL